MIKRIKKPLAIVLSVLATSTFANNQPSENAVKINPPANKVSNNAITYEIEEKPITIKPWSAVEIQNQVFKNYMNMIHATMNNPVIKMISEYKFSGVTDIELTFQDGISINAINLINFYQYVQAHTILDPKVEGYIKTARLVKNIINKGLDNQSLNKEERTLVEILNYKDISKSQQDCTKNQVQMLNNQDVDRIKLSKKIIQQSDNIYIDQMFAHANKDHFHDQSIIMTSPLYRKNLEFLSNNPKLFHVLELTKENAFHKAGLDVLVDIDQRLKYLAENSSKQSDEEHTFKENVQLDLLNKIKYQLKQQNAYLKEIAQSMKKST